MYMYELCLAQQYITHCKTTVTCEDNRSGYLLDHDASKIPMLKGSVDRVLSSQVCSQLHVEFVQFVHLFQCQLHLTRPVCGYKSGRGREAKGKQRERQREGGGKVKIREMEGRREGKRQK